MPKKNQDVKVKLSVGGRGPGGHRVTHARVVFHRGKNAQNRGKYVAEFPSSPENNSEFLVTDYPDGKAGREARRYLYRVLKQL